MPLIFVFVVGMALALIRRRLVVAPADRMARGDVPAQLVGWTVGLLSAGRHEWGQAMVGELDRLDGRARRWRFALDCVGAALVLPPWGRAAAAVGGLTVVATGAGGLVAYTQIHYRLGADGWTWAGAAILLIVLAAYVLAGGALLRRPGSAGPGLVGGLVVAVAWLAVGRFAYNQMVDSFWSNAWLLIVAPVVVGVVGTLWGGSAAAGRRTVRLATVCAALAVYLYGVLAVAVVGASGRDPSDGWTDAQVVADRLGNQFVFYLFALPVLTVAIGWGAAAATARLRGAGPASATLDPVLPAAGTGPAWEDPPVSHGARPGDLAAVEIPAAAARRRRIAYRLVVVCAALVAVALVALTLMRA